MTPQQVNSSILTPALLLLPAKMDSLAARVQLVATGWQESKFLTRTQYGGPAHSYFQIELGGGIAGVLGNKNTGPLATAVAIARGIPATASGIYNAMLTDDVIGAVVARLILWLDPAPLPQVGDMLGGWSCYLKNWRPGKPRPNDWPESYERAMQITRT